MCGLARSSGFGGCTLQHPPKPPTVFGVSCVPLSPMKYLKHVLKPHINICQNTVILVILTLCWRERDLPKIIKLKAKERRIPGR